jgi:hypothetical protein
MKVYISSYRYHWLSPYTILEKVLFWKDWEKIEYEEPWVEKWANRILPFSTALQKALDFIHPKVNYVKIDYWDTWSMDRTLSYIILPMLKQLKATKHGAPLVDDIDVPDELKSTNAPPKENEYDVDAYHFDRWDYVLNEMIFAFENKVDDSWEEKYHTGKIDYKFVKSEKTFFNPVTKQDESVYESVKGPNDTYHYDSDGAKKEHDRMANGFRLFGKYYEGLWD